MDRKKHLGGIFPPRKDFDVSHARRLARSGVHQTLIAAFFHVSVQTLKRRGIKFPRKGKPLFRNRTFLIQADTFVRAGATQRQAAEKIGKPTNFLRRHKIGDTGKSGQQPIAPARLHEAALMHLYGATERHIHQKLGISRPAWRKYKPNWIRYLATPKV
jgi:hypothetical protein